MGQAIVEGWLKSDEIHADQIYASARNQARLKENTERLGITAIESNQELVELVDIVIIAVKPYQIKEIFEPMKDLLKDKTLVSLAVNILFDDFEEFLSNETQHLSTLPNTPVGIEKEIFYLEKKNIYCKKPFL